MSVCRHTSFDLGFRRGLVLIRCEAAYISGFSTGADQFESAKWGEGMAKGTI